MLGDAVYYALATLFYLAPRALYEVHIDEDDPTTFPPSTLIVTNHKRDLDSVILPATLYWLQRPPRRMPHFAGREDMFVRGFLASFDVVPRWLRRVLYQIDLTVVMHALRIHPVRRFPERTMDEALREARQVLGDRVLADVLGPDEPPPVIRARGSGLTLSQALAWEFRDWWQQPARLRAFVPGLRESLAARQREVVEQQMRELAAVLTDGEVLYITPEGVISPDGRLQAFRSGLRQILALTRGVGIRPACIAYDFMRPGPLRVFIHVGRLAPASGPPDAMAEVTRRRLAALHVMTATQICSQVVWDHLNANAEPLGHDTLVRRTADLAATLRDDGLRVDPAVLRDPAASVDAWVRYTVRRGWVRVEGPALRVEKERITSTPGTHWGNPVRYGVNELHSVRAALRGEVEAAAASGCGRRGRDAHDVEAAVHEDRVAGDGAGEVARQERRDIAHIFDRDVPP